MKEIRFHGRGGQGAVTAAEVLAVAAFKEGKYSQAFPFFGVERRGAPVMAFTRIDDEFIRLREQVYKPNYIVVLDPTLMEVVNVFEGMREGGVVVVNTAQMPDLPEGVDVRIVDATKIALEEIGKPFVNTPMLGALIGVTGLVNIDSLVSTIKERYPGEVGEKNARAIKRTYEEIKEG
ncbi:MAG: pyruvate ferredoxin oxidoreductase subunit gamma [Candidatus Diapherotrites archaeon]|nr:pyruvate ferredoxin oxidoreductase subunit gamma [Candidatus Diapherotrites archaeon]